MPFGPCFAAGAGDTQGSRKEDNDGNSGRRSAVGEGTFWDTRTRRCAETSKRLRLQENTSRVDNSDDLTVVETQRMRPQLR